MIYANPDLVITGVSPWRDLLIFRVCYREVREKEDKQEFHFICLDSRTFDCAPDKLASINFFWSPEDHTIVIGEIGEGPERELLSFLEIKDYDDFDTDGEYDKAVAAVIFPS